MTTVSKAQPPAAPAAPKAKPSRAASLSLLRKVWPWVFLISMVTVFTIWAKVANNTDFLSPRAVQAILVYATQILLVALGETLIMIAAGVDLSAGYILGLSAVVGAEIMKRLYAAGVPSGQAIAAGMLGGLLVTFIPGWINGWLATRWKVPPFISTLGMGYAVYGAALLLCGGLPVANLPPDLGQLGNGSILYFWPGHGISFFELPEGAAPRDLTAIVPILPNVVLITVVVTAIFWFLLAKTQFGRHVYAIGGNYEAAVRAGIPVARVVLLVYILGALLSGVAGNLWAARFTSGAADGGIATTLYAIAAVVIGGASMFGGEGTIVGTVVGSLIIATIQFGLVVLGMPPYWQYAAVGTVVIVAVIVDQFGRTLER